MEMPLQMMVKDPNASTDFAKNTVVFRETTYSTWFGLTALNHISPAPIPSWGPYF